VANCTIETDHKAGLYKSCQNGVHATERPLKGGRNRRARYTYSCARTALARKYALELAEHGDVLPAMTPVASGAAGVSGDISVAAVNKATPWREQEWSRV
jgi:hypothetical protein